MTKRLNEKIEENFNKGIRNYLDAWYNDRYYAPLGVDLRIKDELCLRVSLSCKHEDENKKNVPFSIHLEFAIEGGNRFEKFWDEEGEIKYFENYDVKKPKNEMDFFKKVYDVIDEFMNEYKQEALDTLNDEIKKIDSERKEMDNYIEKVENKTKKVISDLEKEGFKVEKHEYEFYNKVGTAYLYLKDKVDGEKTFERISKILSKYGDLDKEYSDIEKSLFALNFPRVGELKEKSLIKDIFMKSKKQFKKFNSKAINEAELTELKDAIINREEFVDENVVGTSIGEDYIVSVFDKAVLIFTSDNTPYIIEREDLEEEEMGIVEELYSALEITVDVEEDEEIFVDDNTSDDLDVSEKFIKESSFAKADKELKSVVKDLKDEFDIVSSEVDKGVHGNDSAQEDGYDWLYVGKIKYSNDITKEMLEEYKEWFEDVYGGRFDYDMNDKTIDVELGYGDDKDMIVSMEKFMFESKKSNKFSKKAIKESKQKSKTIIKESGERVTTFKKGFNFKKYSRK